MTSDLLQRIRWGNVGRAAAVLAAVLLVVAWPRLRSAQPAVPLAVARPAIPGVETAPPRTSRHAPAHDTRAPLVRKRHAARHASARRHHPGRRHRLRHAPGEARMPVAPSPLPTAPVAWPAGVPPAPTPAGGEFRP